MIAPRGQGSGTPCVRRGWSGSAAPLPPTKYSPPCGLFVLCYASSARRTSSRTHCAPFSLYNASIRRTAASLAAFASLSFFSAACSSLRTSSPDLSLSLLQALRKDLLLLAFQLFLRFALVGFRLLCALARLLIHFDNGFYHLIQIGHPFRQRYFDS